jgi:pimeloyl-ACP methyl ester carboxylesterase
VDVRGVLTRASAVLDRGVVRLMERRITAAARMARGTQAPAPDAADGPRPAPRDRGVDPALDLALDPDAARRQMAELARVYGDGTLGLPSRFFLAPDEPVVQLAPAGGGPLRTHVVDLSYRSDYEPFLPAARELHLRATVNLTAHVRWWTSGRGRPVLVVLHGWAGGHHWVTERTFAVEYWLRHGWDVAAFVLPFHGDRAPGSHPLRSGALFPSTNPVRTNEGFGQAIHDLRALSRFLRGRGAPAVGALGMSLGGYTTALWASVAGPDDVGGIDFAVAMIPAVSMARLMWRHGANSPERARAVKAGITEDLLAAAFAVHTPTTRPARPARDRLFVIGGRGDRVTPPEQAEALAAHWGVEVRWFDGGHLAQLGRGEVLRDVRRALGRLGFAGRMFRGAPADRTAAAAAARSIPRGAPPPVSLRSKDRG